MTIIVGFAIKLFILQRKTFGGSVTREFWLRISQTSHQLKNVIQVEEADESNVPQDQQD